MGLGVGDGVAPGGSVGDGDGDGDGVGDGVGLGLGLGGLLWEDRDASRIQDRSGRARADGERSRRGIDPR